MGDLILRDSHINTSSISPILPTVKTPRMLSTVLSLPHAVLFGSGHLIRLLILYSNFRLLHHLYSDDVGLTTKKKNKRSRIWFAEFNHFVQRYLRLLNATTYSDCGRFLIGCTTAGVIDPRPQKALCHATNIGYGINIDIDNILNCSHDSAIRLGMARRQLDGRSEGRWLIPYCVP